MASELCYDKTFQHDVIKSFQSYHPQKIILTPLLRQTDLFKLTAPIDINKALVCNSGSDGVSLR